MNDLPLVSIIIPVYKVEKYLKECVESAKNQTYDSIEIILVDDGSPDRCGRMCDDYTEKDARIVTIHQQNGGLSKARNTGLKHARGEYVYFLDSDDYIDTRTIESLVETAEEESADFVFFDGKTFFDSYETNSFVSDYERKQKYPARRGREQLKLLFDNDEYRTAVPLSFYNRKYLLQNNLFFKEGILHEDELFMLLVFDADGIAAHCHKELYYRRMHTDSIMTTENQEKKYDSLRIIYDELWDKYFLESVKYDALNAFMIRTAKMVIYKYRCLSDKLKAEKKKDYDLFKKKVLKQKAYGDYKLRLKCSNKISFLFLKAERKLGLLK